MLIATPPVRRLLLPLLALSLLPAVSLAAAESTAPIVEIDAQTRLRTSAAPPFQAVVRVLHVGTTEERLEVRAIRIRDDRGQVLAEVRPEAEAHALGDVWERLEPLRRMEHDEVYLYAGHEDANAMFARLERSAVARSLRVDLQALNPRWTTGIRLGLHVQVDVSSSLAGDFSIEQKLDIDILRPLPSRRFPAGMPPGNFFLGDTHVHSAWTDCDNVFRAIFPIGPGGHNPRREDDDIRSLYTAAGLSWVALADHCYCVHQGQYGDLHAEAETFSVPGFQIIPGLEISTREEHIEGSGQCGNDGFNTAHFNAIGMTPNTTNFDYYGLFGRRFACETLPLTFQSQAPHVQGAIFSHRSLASSPSGVLSLNHAGGTGLDGDGQAWNMSETSFACADSSTETGMELINELWDDNQDAASVQRWIRYRLLKGHRVAAYGGSDMHRRRDVIGATFTGVFADNLSRSAARSVEDGLAQGITFASSGPSLLALFAGPPAAPITTLMGQTLDAPAGAPIRLQISFDDGGKPMQLCLKRGVVGAGTEQSVALDGGDPCLDVDGSGIASVQVSAPASETYYRVEARALNDGHWRAFSSALWLR